MFSPKKVKWLSAILPYMAFKLKNIAVKFCYRALQLKKLA
jgi:hypothetical protein